VARRGAVLRDPPYAESVEHQVERLQGPLEIVEGTTVSLVAEPTARGDEPEMRCTGQVAGNGSPLPLEARPAGGLATPFFTPKANMECVFQLS